MKLVGNLAAVAALAFGALVITTPAAAQATRTWVSGVGDDVNPCSRTAPCQTFAGAISKTTAGGEIDCLDPGGFGTVTITKAITIDCSADGHFGGITAPGNNGVTVNPGAGVYVQLINLFIDGLGTGLNGVKVLTGNVLIANSYIYDFQGASNCNATVNTGGTAVCVSGPAGTKVTMENDIVRNSTFGLINNPSAGANTVIAEHSVFDGNITTGIETTAAGAKLFLNGDSLINTPTAIATTGGTLITFGNNAITGTAATLTLQAPQ